MELLRQWQQSVLFILAEPNLRSLGERYAKRQSRTATTGLLTVLIVSCFLFITLQRSGVKTHSIPEFVSCILVLVYFAFLILSVFPAMHNALALVSETRVAGSIFTIDGTLLTSNLSGRELLLIALYSLIQPVFRTLMIGTLLLASISTYLGSPDLHSIWPLGVDTLLLLLRVTASWVLFSVEAILGYACFLLILIGTSLHQRATASMWITLLVALAFQTAVFGIGALFSISYDPYTLRAPSGDAFYEIPRILGWLIFPSVLVVTQVAAQRIRVSSLLPAVFLLTACYSLLVAQSYSSFRFWDPSPQGFFYYLRLELAWSVTALGIYNPMLAIGQRANWGMPFFEPLRELQLLLVQIPVVFLLAENAASKLNTKLQL